MARIPFVTVTGFLGSGKTSLINALLAHRPAERILVMVNELGEVAVDHRLLAPGEGQTVIALPGGCLCCAYRGELGGRLKAVLDSGVEVERIVIETSGLASPVAVERELMADPDLAPLLKVGGVVCCLDARDGAERLAAFGEAQVQLALADRVVLTKTDLCDRAAAERALAAWATDAPLFLAPATPDLLDQVFADLPPGRRPRTPPTHQAHVQIETFTVDLAATTIEDAYDLIAAGCAAAGDALLRLKGFLRPTDTGRAFAVQAVGGLLYPLVEMPAGGGPDGGLTLIGLAGLRDRLMATPDGRRLLQA